MDELEMIQMQMDTIEKACKTVLKRKISWLINELEYELKQLKEDSNYSPNDDGIIKDVGRDIDDMCIKIALIERIRNKY